MVRLRLIPSTAVSKGATVVLPPTARPVPSSSISGAAPPASKVRSETVIAKLTAHKERLAGITGQEGWPANVRVEPYVNNRELYWKVPSSQRDELRKLLKED